jgi:DNA-binding PadR family transcriptional regulator
VIYPTLTFLEEAGYVSSTTEGNKKVYSITDAGQAHLEENRELVDGLLDGIKRFGAKMAKAQEWFGSNDDAEDVSERGRRRGKRGEFRAVRRRLRAALGDIVDAPAAKQAEALAILENAANALEALSRS